MVSPQFGLICLGQPCTVPLWQKNYSSKTLSIVPLGIGVNAMQQGEKVANCFRWHFLLMAGVKMGA